MGYSTDFTGVLEFKNKIDMNEIMAIERILGKDARKYPEWKAGNLTHIDFELTDDYSGICWDGGEKSYDMTEKVNLIIRLMKEEGYDDFELVGELKAQGEEFSDRWFLRMVDGVAVKIPCKSSGDEISCPKCHHVFSLED